MMSSFSVLCVHCNQQIRCTSESSHLAHCSKEKDYQIIPLMNYNSIYQEYPVENDSETDSVIYPFDSALQDIYCELERYEINAEYFIYQINLINYYEDEFQNPKRMKSRLVDTDGNAGFGNVLDYMDIHRFATKVGLSISEGDTLLSLIQRISERNKCNVIIPREMRTISAAIEKATDLSNRLVKVLIPYPEGLLEISDLEPVEGYFLNPLFVLAEYFLQLSLDDVITRPTLVT